MVSVHGFAIWWPCSEVEKHCNIIDDSLCRLIDRLWESGYEHTLEVEFLAWQLVDWVKGMDFENRVPKFKEKGEVRIAQMPAWMVTSNW